MQRVRRPYRLLWITQGLTHDGWLLPGARATVRLFGHARPGRRAVNLTLASSQLATKRIGFEITVEGTTVRGTVDPGGARPPVDVTVCLPAGGAVDIGLLSRCRSLLQDGRTAARFQYHEVSTWNEYQTDTFATTSFRTGRVGHRLVGGVEAGVSTADTEIGLAAAAPLDIRDWLFVNTDLTVHLFRDPVGEWMGVDAATVVGPAGLGTAAALLFDEQGQVGRSAQNLVVRPR